MFFKSRNNVLLQTSRQKLAPAARLTNRNRRITQAEAEIRRILAGHEPILNDEGDTPSRRIGQSAIAHTDMVRRDTPYVKGDGRQSRVSFVDMDPEEIALRRDTPYIKEPETEKTSPKMPPRVSFAPQKIEENSIKLENRRNTPFHDRDELNTRPSS